MKRIYILLITLLLCAALASCTASSGTDNTAQTSGSALSESESVTDAAPEMTFYDSEYGKIPYPAEYKDAFSIEEKKQDDGELDVVFSTDIEGEKYELFTLLISDSEEGAVGIIKDEGGARRYIVADMNEIDASSISEETQNKVYAMQESINDIIDNLQ